MERSRSRSPLKSSVVSEDGSQDDDSSNIKPTAIKIEYIPRYWNEDRTNKFLESITTAEEIMPGIKYVRLLKYGGEFKGACLVVFYNSDVCTLAMQEWSALSKSRNIRVSYGSENIPSIQHIYKKVNTKQPQPQPQQHTVVPRTESNFNETYGLSAQFLKDLKIKLPLNNRVYVANLDPRVDEAKLREVFGYAGNVTFVKIIAKDDGIKCFAKVVYDHPVEAVQAITMLHNRDLYGKTLVVHMDLKPMNDLPEGLSGFGPGLGPGGEPMRGVRNEIEIKPLKAALFEELKKLKKAQNNDGTNGPMKPFQQESMMPMNNQMPVVPPNPFVAPAPIMPWSFMNPAAIIPNIPILPNINQDTNLQQMVNAIMQNKLPTNFSQAPQNTQWQNTGVEGHNNSSQPSSTENRSSDYGNNRSSNDSQRKFMDDNRFDERENTRSRDLSRNRDSSDSEKTDMLLFKNLPPTVSLKALNSKMQEVGEVKFAELTGSGRAIVRFFNTRDAERCIRLFDKSKVDGNVIDVKYF